LNRKAIGNISAGLVRHLLAKHRLRIDHLLAATRMYLEMKVRRRRRFAGSSR
jgi:hypothetical protein